MTREEALKLCRVYRGEKMPPMDRLTGQYDFIFWEAEERFVNPTKGREKDIEDTIHLSVTCNADLSPQLPAYLCALLFALFCKGSDRDPKELAPAFNARVLPIYLARPLYR